MQTQTLIPAPIAPLFPLFRPVADFRFLFPGSISAFCFPDFRFVVFSFSASAICHLPFAISYRLFSVFYFLSTRVSAPTSDSLGSFVSAPRIASDSLGRTSPISEPIRAYPRPSEAIRAKNAFFQNLPRPSQIGNETVAFSLKSMTQETSSWLTE